MAREIQLTRGLTAIVDDADFGWLSQYAWRAHESSPGVFYAHRLVPGGSIAMHREILGVGAGAHGDHINGNTLDNSRSNLRACTHTQNTQNRGPSSNNTSGFKGVSKARRGKWRANIRADGKGYFLGSGFKTAEDAARAYDEAARRLHGEFARLNFPGEAG